MSTHDSKPQSLENAEPRKNIGNLKRARHAQAVDGTSVQAMYRISVQKNLAGRRPKQTRNQMKQRGLSRAVGSDDGVTLSLPQVQIENANNMRFAERHMHSVTSQKRSLA